MSGTLDTRPPALGRPSTPPVTSDQLDTWPAPAGSVAVGIETTELTALCPMTGQPDFYTARIRYRPTGRIVESKSLKLYLCSFRQRCIGVEDLTAEIRDALAASIEPAALTVELLQQVRGGLQITATADLHGGVTGVR